MILDINMMEQWRFLTRETQHLKCCSSSVETDKMEARNGSYESYLERFKPYIAMISLQFGYAGLTIVSKASLNSGMSHYVLVVYRHAFATAAIAPFALLLERYVQYICFFFFIEIIFYKNT